MDGFVTLTTAKELGLSPETAGELDEVSRDGARIKLEQFKVLMSEIIAEAMKDNNELLTTHVEERILKEMNYLMQEHYQMEQDYYKKLDEVIRGSIRKKKQEKKKLFAKKRTP